MWVMEQFLPGTSAHALPVAYRVQGDLDVTSLHRAVHTVVQRHEILRTRCPVFEGKPYQLVDPVGPKLRIDDLRAEPDPLRTATETVAAEVCAGFDLAAGPLFRARLLRVGLMDHVLVLTFHHSAFDAKSLDVFAGELSAAFALLRRGRRPAFGELPLQYADFAAWQRDRVLAGQFDGQAAYWRRQLAGAPETATLPADRPRPARATFRCGAAPIPIDDETTAAVRRLADETGSGPRVVTLAGFYALLAKYAGATDLIVGLPNSGRNRPELTGLIGLFANLVPVRVLLADDPGFTELVGRVGAAVRDGADNCDLPFGLARNTLVETTFRYFGGDGEAVPGGLSLPGLAVTEFPADVVGVRHDLEFRILAGGGSLTGTVWYQRDMFDEITVSSFARHYAGLLRAVTREPSARLSRFPLVTDQEIALIGGWNDESDHA